MLLFPRCFFRGLLMPKVHQKHILLKFRVILASGQCDSHPLHAGTLKYIFPLVAGHLFKTKKEAKSFIYLYFFQLLLISLPEADLKYRKVNRNIFTFLIRSLFLDILGAQHMSGFSGCFCQINHSLPFISFKNSDSFFCQVYIFVRN